MSRMFSSAGVNGLIVGFGLLLKKIGGKLTGNIWGPGEQGRSFHPGDSFLFFLHPRKAFPATAFLDIAAL
jgi:hypothetical protein